MTEKAPMPPWWVERRAHDGGPAEWLILGGTQDEAVILFALNEVQFSNARELADLIVQRTKQ